MLTGSQIIRLLIMPLSGVKVVGRRSPQSFGGFQGVVMAKGNCYTGFAMEAKILRKISIKLDNYIQIYF